MAVLIEKRGVREVAQAHGVSKTWLYELLARYREGGAEGLVPRSRRPHRSPTRVRAAVEDEIVMLRKHLAEEGFDAGPDTIHSHLARRHRGRSPCSVSTIWRILSRRGFVVPEPHKRPKCSLVRFEASLPNECWQMDVTHVELTSGRVAEVLNVIDDHSRLCVASRAFRTTTAADVVVSFYEAAARYGFPASVLSDNGAVFCASARGDRGALATELARLGIVFKHSRPYHPADSRGESKQLGKLLAWFHESEGGARPVVEASGDASQVPCAVNREVRSSGHVLAQKSIGVLV